MQALEDAKPQKDTIILHILEKILFSLQKLGQFKEFDCITFKVADAEILHKYVNVFYISVRMKPKVILGVKV